MRPPMMIAPEIARMPVKPVEIRSSSSTAEVALRPPSRT